MEQKKEKNRRIYSKQFVLHTFDFDWDVTVSLFAAIYFGKCLTEQIGCDQVNRNKTSHCENDNNKKRNDENKFHNINLAMRSEAKPHGSIQILVFPSNFSLLNENNYLHKEK